MNIMLITLECQHCKQSFQSYACHHKQFCSRLCANIGMKRRKGSLHPMWKGGISKSTCSSCGVKTGDRLSKRCRQCYIATWSNKSNHPNWRGGKPRCVDCQKETCYTRQTKRCRSCNDKWRVGERNPFWHGGVSFYPYPPSFNKALKTYIKERDRYICLLCGMTEKASLRINGKRLAVHHIDYNKNNCRPSNLVTACNSCNGRANGNREYWKVFCRQLIKGVMSNGRK